MRVLISGATGFIGSALAERLRSRGDRVVALTRRPAGPGSDAVQWDPGAGRLDAAQLEGFDAVVHLAGESIGGRRWNDAHKTRVLLSRVEGTRLLAGALAGLERPPRVLLCGSAVGYYGSRGDEVLTEDSPPGQGFLSEVVQEWEAAAAPARDAGIRVLHTRTGLVLDPSGGILKPQLLPFRLGLGARLGSGRQWLPWVTRRDEVRGMEFLLDSDLSGPFNLTSPNPVTNAEFTRVLARTLGRPALLAVPAPALRLALGTEMAEELLLTSQRVVPRRLLDAGFRFEHPELEPALRELLAA